MSFDPVPESLRKPRGVAGQLFVLLAAIGLAGAALDFFLGARERFWIGADPGFGALIGFGVAIFALAAQRLARLVLTRPEREEDAS